MKATGAEWCLVGIIFIQVMTVKFYDTGISNYPKVYEDALGMIAMFLMIIFWFIRKVVGELK